METPPWPDTIAGFRLVQQVHRGTMSSVWRAVDDLQIPAAVKLVPSELAPAADAATLDWLVEVSRHPGLVALIDHGTEGQWWFQIAAWVEGETLESLHRSQRLPPGDSAKLSIWMKQVAAALDAFSHWCSMKSNWFE
jgi:serine/threonine protein kinase